MQLYSKPKIGALHYVECRLAYLVKLLFGHETMRKKETKYLSKHMYNVNRIFLLTTEWLVRGGLSSLSSPQLMM